MLDALQARERTCSVHRCAREHLLLRVEKRQMPHERRDYGDDDCLLTNGSQLSSRRIRQAVPQSVWICDPDFTVQVWLSFGIVALHDVNDWRSMLLKD